MKDLELQAVIGFAGHVPGGLFLYDETHILYPLGSTLICKTLLENTQEFYRGHTDPISCLCVNNDRTLIATGEKAHLGFTAKVIVWDAIKKKRKYTLDLHKGSIQSVCFSPNGLYLASLGGEDDNKLVLWDMKTGEAICGSPAHKDHALTIKFCNNDNNKMVTCGKFHMRTWDIDRKNRKIRPTNCKLGSVKRVLNSILISDDDSIMYAGSASGDIICVAALKNLFKGIGPAKKTLSGGIRVLCKTNNKNYIIAGAGDGTVALINTEKLGYLKVIKSIKLDGAVTSLCLNKNQDHFFVGTANGNIYLVCLEDFEYELRRSSHYNKINCVAYPHKTSEIFVTASINDIRVWNQKSTHELLRIKIPNIECMCVDVTTEGKHIVSGWSDGKIRVFLPESGRLVFAINDAHTGLVNTIKALNDGQRIVSGGADGRVRVWNTESDAPTLITSWKEHKGSVTHLELNSDHSSMMSSSSDGSCILWCLNKYHRKNALFDQNQFTHVLYHPDQSQLLTCGTDRKISWWDAADMETIRIVDGSDSASINSLAINKTGKNFVSGGNDQLVKLWLYDEGEVTHTGYGHSGNITAVSIAENNKTIISVGEEGGIFLWKFPQ